MEVVLGVAGQWSHSVVLLELCHADCALSVLFEVLKVEVAFDYGIDDSIALLLLRVSLRDVPTDGPVDQRPTADAEAAHASQEHRWPKRQSKDTHPVHKIEKVPSFEAPTCVLVEPEDLRPVEKYCAAYRADDELEDAID